MNQAFDFRIFAVGDDGTISSVEYAQYGTGIRPQSLRRVETHGRKVYTAISEWLDSKERDPYALFDMVATIENTRWEKNMIR